MLTYFGLIVIKEHVTTKGSYPQDALGAVAPAAQPGSLGAKHTGCRAATQKRHDAQATQADAAGNCC
jgi:hypothetical protein